ncbi:MAG: ArsR family transcriptional regulator [Methanothrix sp.]
MLAGTIVVIIVKNFLTEINYLYHKVLQLLQGIKNKEKIAMKESFVMRFDEKDIEVVETLKSLGVPRKVSNMIAYLASGNEATSREIERGSDLRQPEVSIALRTLRKNNWVEERMSKSDGTGRPMKVYRLKAPIEEILAFYEQEKLKEATQAMQSIQKLKALLGETGSN